MEKHGKPEIPVFATNIDAATQGCTPSAGKKPLVRKHTLTRLTLI